MAKEGMAKSVSPTDFMPALPAGQTIAAGQYLNRSADRKSWRVCNGTQEPDGIAWNSGVAGGPIDVVPINEKCDAPVLSGAAFAAGSNLMSNAEGKAVVATANNWSTGYADEAATAANQLVAQSGGKQLLGTKRRGTGAYA